MSFPSETGLNKRLAFEQGHLLKSNGYNAHLRQQQVSLIPTVVALCQTKLSLVNIYLHLKQIFVLKWYQKQENIYGQSESTKVHIQFLEIYLISVCNKTMSFGKYKIMNFKWRQKIIREWMVYMIFKEKMNYLKPSVLYGMINITDIDKLSNI